MNTPSKFLQENILCLLVYDDINSKIIASIVDYNLFEGDYAAIAKRTINYVKEFDIAPKDHLSDLFEDILTGENETKKLLYTKIFVRIRDSYEGINSEYVMNKLMTWMRYQGLKNTIIDCAELITQSNDVDVTSEVENKLSAGLKKQFDIFDIGTVFGSNKSLGFLEKQAEPFKTGIPEFDENGIGPARGELFVNIGLNKSGKSFWLLNLARYALYQRLKVCYVTLELSEEKIAQRLYQNLFVIPKRTAETFNTKIDKDSLGRVSGFNKKEFKTKTYLNDPHIEEFLKDKLAYWAPRFKDLIIKQFPDGTLTINMLKAYLDGLENNHNFVPDLLIIDYADKMKLNVNNYRFEVSQTYVNLRGLGVERNFAVVTASQSNRAGKNAAVIDESNVAEAWDKIAIADNVITYTQTQEEKKLKLARLFVSNSRNDRDGLTVMISQNYDVGQFYTSSALMTNSDQYFGLVKDACRDP